MTKKITYICDNCNREYNYEMLASDKDRGVLVTILGQDWCRACLKKNLIIDNKK